MSLRIGRLFGINLYIHWTFWLLPLWLVFTHAHDPEAGSLGMRLTLLGALFGCVVLHEYGHALMARTFGIATRDITLYPIGGVARLERMSEKPWEEFWIAIAGPLVNVVIAAVLGLGLVGAALLRPVSLHGPAGEFFVFLLGMNVVLFVFNLLPAFPMDGGRVLRALLSIRLSRLPATRVAVYVSMGMAVLFCLIGVPLFGNPWLIFVGVFLILAGQQELRMLEQEQEGVDAATQPETREAGWDSMPHSAVTVYLWDPRTRAWVPQGVIPAHSFTDRHNRNFNG